MGCSTVMRKLVVRLLPVALLAGSLQAWSQATTGSISGHVSDPSGSVLSGAHVAITDADTGIVTNATTNESGEFTELAMPPHHYTIRVEAPGFETATIAPFELNIDQKARFNIPMKLGA